MNNFTNFNDLSSKEKADVVSYIRDHIDDLMSSSNKFRSITIAVPFSSLDYINGGNGNR